MYDDAESEQLVVLPDELNGALRRTHERANEMKRRRARLFALASSAAACAVVAIVVAVVTSGGDDKVNVGGSKNLGVASGGATTTSGAPVVDGAVPAGFSLSTEGDVQVLVNTTPEPTPSTNEDPSGVAVGDGIAQIRTATIVGAPEVLGRRTVRVTFECVRNTADRIDSVRYVHSGDSVTVQATISGGYRGLACESDAGQTIDLPFPSDVPATVKVVSDRVA